MALRSLFGVSKYTSDIIVVPYYMNFTISTPFLFQKTDAISFLEDVCLKCFGLFGECVCIQCFGCSLVSTFTDETQISSPVIRTNVIAKFTAIFVVSL
jgi:hypothetical protein